MKKGIAMLALAMGLCWGFANRATTLALTMPQDDKMQSGDKMKDEKMKDDKMAGDKMGKKKSKMHKKDKMNKMDKKEGKDKMGQPKS